MNPLWQPRSGCDASCLPRGHPTVPGWCRLARLVATAAVVLAAVLVLALVPLRQRPAWLPALSRAVLWCLGLRRGGAASLPGRPALIVANHISWLDVLALLAAGSDGPAGPVRLLAKREVRTWPVIGWLAAAVGTLFVDRSRPRALPDTVRAIAAALRAGAAVAVFPEGTTWCGRAGGRFRPATFQAALAAGVPVVPVEISYRTAGGDSTAPAFVGGATLVSSLWRVVAARDLEVHLAVRAPVPAAGRVDRRRLAHLAEVSVRGCTAGSQVVTRKTTTARAIMGA